MIHQIRLAGSDVWIVQRLMNRQRVGFVPLPVLIKLSALCNLADVDFRVEVGGESLAVVSGVAVHDVEMLHL